MHVRRLRALVILFLALVFTPARAHDHSFGTHGMVLFGDRDGLYLSHLPLFKTPHDRQIVLRVRLLDPELDRSMRAALDGKTDLWTIEPERFELSRLDPTGANLLRSFQADIVQGHFEREGKRVHTKAQFVVDYVKMYRRLEAAPRVSSQARYHPVGRFLVKHIDSRPDFDHIVALSRPARGTVTVPKTGVENPEAVLATLADVIGTVYFETGDLR